MTKYLNKTGFVSWLEEQVNRCEKEAENARQLMNSEHSGQMIPAEECYARQYERLAEHYRLLCYKHIMEEGMFDIGDETEE